MVLHRLLFQNNCYVLTRGVTSCIVNTCLVMQNMEMNHESDDHNTKFFENLYHIPVLSRKQCSRDKLYI